MATFDTPETRADFEERMGVLVEMCRTGRMRFVEGVGGYDSISRVRYLPNGRVDFLSIDESARLQANMAHQMPTFAPSFDSDED
ncbi:hypothetical protein IFT96_01135 [Pseudomonas fluorescens]|nr:MULTISPECIES: AVAST type 1 anti-phage system protein Avs1c [Pseudomonas]MBD8253971.1 hypothetical protein [Pseudomonas fluorescens]MBD8271672.1 hypothetical protein [Pseudomonas fluorescens]MDR9875520.1 AVAST type 1 anti-phage system protein Avs1c [Pseudomonas allii]MDV3056699.1 hypothetical protein [Pseudomonas paracarnis]